MWNPTRESGRTQVNIEISRLHRQVVRQEYPMSLNELSMLFAMDRQLQQNFRELQTLWMMGRKP